MLRKMISFSAVCVLSSEYLLVLNCRTIRFGVSVAWLCIAMLEKYRRPLVEAWDITREDSEKGMIIAIHPYGERMEKESLKDL